MTNGDLERQAFSEFVSEFEADMSRSIWRITREANAAEDALQIALLTIWQRWDRVLSHPNRRALLLRICIDSGLYVRRQLRRLRETHVEAELMDQVPMQECRFDEQLEMRELTQFLLESIEKLPAKQSTCIWLRFVEDLEYPIIASSLGIAESTVRKHVQRGRETLKRMMANQSKNHINLTKETS